MTRDVELSSLDLRYEGYRVRNPAQEAKLLVSIQERGIEKPLEGVEAGGKRVLLDGFRRYRCARKLSIGLVPFVSLGEGEAEGIVAMMRASNDKGLSILEQARFVDDLHRIHRMEVAEIADRLFRSRSWVLMRLGLIGDMSRTVREKVFAGAFPVYSYMYALRPYLRTRGVGNEAVDAFVSKVSGKRLSVREISQLAHGYFEGPDWFRKELESGNLALALERIRGVSGHPDGCNNFERALLKDLEILSKYMLRAMGKSGDKRTKVSTPAFRAQANLLLSGILSRFGAVRRTLEELHDRTGEA